MNFCFIPWINWDSYLYSRPHQLVREALRRGHRVLYLNPGMQPVVRDGNLEVWHPLSHPFFGNIKKILRREFFQAIFSYPRKETNPFKRMDLPALRRRKPAGVPIKISNRSINKTKTAGFPEPSE